MIKQIYIDNYKCYSNAKIKLRDFNLILGPNGTGKTAMFEALEKIKRLVIEEEKTNNIFRPTSLTRWDTRTNQKFEIVIEANKIEYVYEIMIDYNLTENVNRIKYERLKVDGKKIFSFEMGEVQLYRDDFSEGPSYPFDWERSALATVMPRNDNKLLTNFKERLSKVYIIRLYPPSMNAESRSEARTPTTGFENFTSWYRHFSQEQPQIMAKVFEDLSESLTGFEQLRMTSTGKETRVMEASFTHGSGSDEKTKATYTFDELSDGQRAIIALYSTIRFTMSENATLCIDEPGNYLGIDEVEPWVSQLESLCTDKTSQACMISHHPELIDSLALSDGILFSRPDNGPVRTGRVDPTLLKSVKSVSVSELMARGWLNE